MTPSWRKPVGAFTIIGLIILWAALIGSLAHWVGDWPVLLQGVFYLLTGLIWIVPLKPLIRWIETGRWRAPTGQG
jgi:hypothetical protein